MKKSTLAALFVMPFSTTMYLLNFLLFLLTFIGRFQVDKKVDTLAIPKSYFSEKWIFRAAVSPYKTYVLSNHPNDTVHEMAKDEALLIKIWIQFFPQVIFILFKFSLLI